MDSILQSFILPSTQKRLGPDNKLLLISSKPVFEVMVDYPFAVMEANCRIIHSIGGILRAAEELDSIVIFGLARSEGGMPVGYSGMNPYSYFDTIVKYAREMNFSKPFIIHADHTQVRGDTAKDVETGREYIKAAIDAGYTSANVDASFNPFPQNIRISVELASIVQEAGLGYESEVGEIPQAGKEGDLTSVQEAAEFIEALQKNNIFPQLLAINNGSKHGNKTAQELAGLDLVRTKEVYEAIKKYGVAIAQHGTTGISLEILNQFADSGIRKANVATEWQNIAHRGLPKDLMERMEQWVKDNSGKELKHATQQFKKEIDSIPEENKKWIEEESYKTAKMYFTAFRAQGSASEFIRRVSENRSL